MRYFHRTSLGPDAVVAEADRFFGGRLSPASSAARQRAYNGPIGKITVRVVPEGGHYTNVTFETDQVGESEADKLAKRFLGLVHQKVEPTHEMRGAY